MGPSYFRSTGIASLCAAFLCLSGSAQSAPDDPKDQPVRAISLEEGESIVQAVWDLRKGLDPKPDCSHFVHQVYTHAGLDYEYANSIAIYQGIPEFRRVQKPQPGDLIVWPGHVGIMIEPSEHSFYSSVVKGFAMENYRSPYWARRGPPRFYRYLVDEVRIARLRAHPETARPEPVRVANTRRPAPPSTVPRVISDGPVYSGDPVDVSEKDVSEKGVSSVSEKDVSKKGASETPLKATAPPRTEEPAAADAGAFDTLFVSSHSRPKGSEIHSALLELAQANGARVLRTGPLQSMTVEIADDLVVDTITVHGRSGSAEIEIYETASIQNGKAFLHKRTARWRFPLQHEARGWIMLIPAGKACLPHDQVIQALSARVAQMSRDSENQSEIQRTVRVLEDLLAGETRYTPVSGSN